MKLVDVGAGPIERARAIAAVAESMGATATLDYCEFAPPPRVHAYAVRIELGGRTAWALATANVDLRVAAERYGVGAPDGWEEPYALVVDRLDAGLPGLLPKDPIATHEAIDARARAGRPRGGAARARRGGCAKRRAAAARRENKRGSMQLLQLSQATSAGAAIRTNRCHGRRHDACGSRRAGRRGGWPGGLGRAVAGLARGDRATARGALREGGGDGPWDVVSRVQHSIGVIGTQGPKRYVRGIDDREAPRWRYPGLGHTAGARAVPERGGAAGGGRQRRRAAGALRTRWRVEGSLTGVYGRRCACARAHDARS